jgi:hypothetical protein
MEYKATSHNFSDYIRFKSFAFNLININIKFLRVVILRPPPRLTGSNNTDLKSI